jgi:hypothetical protein
VCFRRSVTPSPTGNCADGSALADASTERADQHSTDCPRARAGATRGPTSVNLGQSGRADAGVHRAPGLTADGDKHFRRVGGAWDPPVWCPAGAGPAAHIARPATVGCGCGSGTVAIAVSWVVGDGRLDQVVLAGGVGRKVTGWAGLPARPGRVEPPPRLPGGPNQPGPLAPIQDFIQDSGRNRALRDGTQRTCDQHTAW